MKKLRYLSILSLLSGMTFAGFNCANALFEINDKAAIFFNGSVTGRYVSNVFADENNKKDEYMLILSPGLEAVSGEGAPAKIKIFAKEDFYFHKKRSELDRQNFKVTANAEHETARLLTKGFFNFYQTDQNTADVNFVGQLVSRAVIDARLSEEYEFSPKFTIGAGAEFKDVYYRSGQPNFQNYQIYTFPVTLWYRYSEKIELGPSYRYRYTDMRSGGRDRHDHFFNLALRGGLTPKLEAELNMGAQYRKIDGTATTPRAGKNNTTFAMKAILKYAATEKIRAQGQVTRDYSVGGTGQGIQNSGGKLDAFYDFSDVVTANAGVSYNRANYQFSNRKDNNYNGILGVSYSPNTYVRLAAGYAYQYNNSNTVGSSYVNNIVNLSASLRY